VPKENAENLRSKSDTPPAATDSLVGRTIATRWDVVELIADLALTTVYKAEERSTRKVIILKQIPRHLIQALPDPNSFEQRAQMYIALNHEHISNFYDVHIDDNGDIFLFCDYFEFESLEDILSKAGHITVERAAGIFKQAAEGLEYAHKQKILHRDLKPGNVCLVNDRYNVDDVRLVDFGIARLLLEGSEETKTGQFFTESRDTFTNALYVSPEQCRGKKVDARSDIYALGCVMHECVSGKPPFVGRNVMETAYKHMNEAPPPLVSPPPENRNLERYQLIINKALQKNPERRYQTMAELEHDLDIMLEASDNKWQSSANCLKGSPKAVLRIIFKKELPWSAVLSLLAAVTTFFLIGYWSFILLSEDSTTATYPRYDCEQLWVVTNKKAVPSSDNFSTERENLRVELETIEQQKTQFSKEYAHALSSLCRLYLANSHWSDAAIELKRLLQIEKKIDGQGNMAALYSDLALCYFMENENDSALEAAKLVLETQSHHDSPLAWRAKEQALNILGDIYNQEGDNKRALNAYLELFALDKPLQIRYPSTYAKNAARLADAYRRMHDFKNAEHYYLSAMDVWRNYVNHSGEFMAKCNFGYALALADEKKFAESQASIKDALNDAITYTGPKSGLVGALRKQYLDNLYHFDIGNWLKAKIKPGDDSVLRPLKEEIPQETGRQPS